MAKKVGFRKYKKGSPDLHEKRKSEGHAKNLAVFKMPFFKKCCEVAGIEPTMRQASKWRKGRGKAVKA